MTIHITSTERALIDRYIIKSATGMIRLAHGWDTEAEALEAAGLVDNGEPTDYAADIILGRLDVETMGE